MNNRRVFWMLAFTATSNEVVTWLNTYAGKQTVDWSFQHERRAAGDWLGFSIHDENAEVQFKLTFNEIISRS